MSWTPSRQELRQAPPSLPPNFKLPAFPGSPMAPSSPTFGSPQMHPVTPKMSRENMLRRPKSMMTLGGSASASRSSSRLANRSMTIPEMPSAPVYKGTIHVGVRCKPEPQSPSWSVSSVTNSVTHASAGDFSFDAVYEGRSSNADVFSRSVEHLIGRVVEGYNATVFAYGVTGSGKTWTMHGTDDDSDPGIIPQSVGLLYELLPPNARVRLSYLEIYNERAFDLLSLNASGTKAEVMLRDDPTTGGVRPVGLAEVSTQSADELLDYISEGDQLRRTSSTEFNERSSRSHAVVQITVTCNNIESVLYLCDLAGSERALLETERRREGAYINKSLLALSTVISKLSQGGAGHVPYRDSKLTRLLQPSLSGTALVSVLCTIQTSGASDTETLNTLRFAARAKNIVVTAKRGSVFDDPAAGINGAMADQLRQENARLKLELAAANAAKEDLQEQMELYMQARDESADASLEKLSGIANDGEDGSNNGNSEASALRKRLQLAEQENSELHTRITELANQISQAAADVEQLSISAASTPTLSGEVDQADAFEVEELHEQLKIKDNIIQYLSKVNAHKAALGISVPTLPMEV